MPISHKVADGECLSSIAFHYGFFPETVWNAPENAALRRTRANPNVLSAGDVLMIPDRRESSRACATDRRHVFRRKGVPERLRFQFLLGGEPRASEPYELEIDGAVIASGAHTDDDGRIDHWIPPDARAATVRFVETGEAYFFALGRLDPIDSVRGVQSRLKSLGYFLGELDGADDDALRRALAAYQVERGLEPTGEADETTRAALLADHGA